MRYVVFDDMGQCTEQAVKDLLSQVPEFRRAQALKYQHTFGQFCCLKSWQLLQTLFPIPQDSENALLPITYYLLPEYNAYGKPFIKGGPEFSISHCKQAIAVAVNDTPIGIDVESIRKVDPSLIERTMNETEQEMIRTAAQPLRAFTRLWTMKEAYLKYLGTGIVDDLKDCLNTANPARFITLEKADYFLSIYF